MGLQWRQQVDEIPPGWVTLDERFVLFILADETKDDRTAWGHEIAHLCDRLGGVSETWLRARLSSLESAGYITRPRQRRNSKGQWNRRQVSLAALKYGPRHDERGSGVYRPTAQAERKAAADAKRSQNLTQGPPNPAAGAAHRTSEAGPSPNIGGRNAPNIGGRTVTEHRRTTWTREPGHTWTREPGQSQRLRRCTIEDRSPHP